MKLRRRDNGEEQDLRNGAVFGRAPQCEWTLDEESISRKHARVEQRDGAWWLVDLKSSNGCLRNGRKAAEFELQPGDLVTLGALAFDVVGERAPAQTLATPAPVDALLLDDDEPEPPARKAEPTLAESERARLRSELKGARRSRGFGDLSQQPLAIQLIAAAVGIAVLVGFYLAVRSMGGLIDPQ